MNPIKNLVLHHSAVSIKAQKLQLIPVNNYHKKLYGMKSSLGWYVGYNYFIDGNGVMTQTRKDGEETAAVIGHNKDSLHICLAGDFDTCVPTQAQINKLRSWLIGKMQLYGLSVSDIYDHRELQKNRSCPGCLIPRGWARMLVSPIPAQQDDAKKQQDLLNFLG